MSENTPPKTLPTVAGFAIRCALAALQERDISVRKLFDRAGDREVAEVGPFAPFPFPGILKFSLQTRPPVKQLVTFTLDAFELDLQLRRGGFSGRSMACVSSHDAGRGRIHGI